MLHPFRVSTVKKHNPLQRLASSHFWGWVELALATPVVLWGASFVATKVALRSLAPDALVWLRFAMGVVILGVTMLARGRVLLAAVLILNAFDAAVMLYLGLAAGRPWVFALAVAGLALSVFYVAWPIKLKHRGLGELTAFLVWGPLMTGGTYYVVAGSVTPEAWLATLPYGLLVATVLVGKHIDKLQEDAAIGVHSIPVLLGGRNARRLNMALMVSFFLLLVVLVSVGAMGFWILLTLLAVPRLLVALRHYSQPRPAAAPPVPRR